MDAPYICWVEPLNDYVDRACYSCRSLCCDIGFNIFDDAGLHDLSHDIEES